MIDKKVGETVETRLYFVRHAHSAYTPDERERPLSESGRADAEQVKKALESEGIGRVLSSPYKRAIETVEPLAASIGREILLIEGFRERQLSEGPVEDFAAAIAKVWDDEDYAFRGGESNREAKARGVNAALEVVKRYPGERIAIGTHGNLMVLVMNHFDSRYGVGFWRELAMPDIYCLRFDGMELAGVERVVIEEMGS
jgi:2,3-bisphosphoglycerate-dependent phosphoglycerate mutase